MFEVTRALSSTHPRGNLLWKRAHALADVLHGSGGVCRALSPPFSSPPPEPYVALRSFLTSPLCRCFPLSSWLGFKPGADSAATTISIHRAGNKANDLWRRFIAVFIAAPSPPYRPAVQVRAGRIRLHRDKGMQFLVHRCL